MNIQESAFVYIGAFIDELARHGVRHVCVCPGSRSTPLAVICAEHPDMTIWTHIDERSAGFFALGIAKATQKPVVLICTSGTAAANFYPAVIEAYHAQVPLIILSADRPHELRDVGAPQTIDQIRLFGSHVRLFADMAIPEATPGALRYVRTTAARAVQAAWSGQQGPVHLNFPLREPLMPVKPPGYDSLVGDPAFQGRDDATPYVSLVAGHKVIDADQVKRLYDKLSRAQRGLIICGPQADHELPAAVTRLAGHFGFPIFADPLSHGRCGPHLTELVIDNYDAFLRDSSFVSVFQPDLVLRFGAMPTSKALMLYIADSSPCHQIVVDPNGWHEPTLVAAELVQADPVWLCDALVREPLGDVSPSGNPWKDQVLQASAVTRETIRQTLKADQTLFEGRVFSELADILPPDVTLMVGNSMPVRDLDTFFPADVRPRKFFSNRGANGIDGVTSTALGIAAVSKEPVVLVIGDLSFYHDLNGLLAGTMHDIRLTVVLVNNDGGGIFSFLPQAREPRHFETLFGTPTGLDFSPAIEMYKGVFTRIESWQEFREALRTGVRSSGLHVVEVPTHRRENVVQHRKVWAAVNQALADHFLWADDHEKGHDT